MPEVGFGRAEITPPIGTPLSGFIARGSAPSTGVDTPLWVRVMAVRDKGDIFFLFSYELIGVGALLETRILSELKAELGTSFCEERCVFTAVHTHSGPVVGLLLGEPVPAAEYLDIVAAQSVVAAKQAIATLTPAYLYAAERRLPRLTYNRRALLSDGRVSISPAPELPVLKRGPLDDRMTVLLWRDLTGRNLAGMIHYACHGVAVLSQSIGADIPGALATAVEAQLGAPCLFLQGAAGDVNPVTVTASRDDLSQWKGLALANLHRLEDDFRMVDTGVVRAISHPLLLQYASLPDRETARRSLDGLERIAAGDLTSTDLREVLVSFKNTMNLAADQPLDLETARGVAMVLADAARLTLSAIEAHQPPKPAPFPIKIWRIGDLVLVFLPGEIFTATGMRIQGLREEAAILPISYASPLAGYIPDVEAISLGGYEVSDAWRFYGHAAPFAGHSEASIVEETSRMLEQLFS
jgi:hypothetical protein